MIMRYIYFIPLLMLLAIGCKSKDPMPQPQPKPTPQVDRIDIDKDYYLLTPESQTLEISFAANAEYSIEIGDGWISEMVDSRAMESYVERFAVEKNMSEDPRSTYIKIIVGNLEQSIVVEQSGTPKRSMTLELTHSESILISPTWRGEGVGGTILWGDGEEQQYEDGANHQFSGAEHTTTFDMYGATGFRVESLGDISDITIGI